MQNHVSSPQKFHNMIETKEETKGAVNSTPEVKHIINGAVWRQNAQVKTSVKRRYKYPSHACSRKDDIHMMEYIWESGGKKHSGVFHLSFMLAWNFMMLTWVQSDNMRRVTMNDIMLLSDLYQPYPQSGGRKRKHGEDEMNTGCRLFLDGTKKDHHKSDGGFVWNRDVVLYAMF
jgi:hypothetical protein